MTNADKRKRAEEVYESLYDKSIDSEETKHIALDAMLAFAAELEAAAIERCKKVYGWSLVRSILKQGAAIQQDYEAGKYPSYEHYSARVNEAARERADAIAKLKESQ